MEECCKEFRHWRCLRCVQGRCNHYLSSKYTCTSILPAACSTPQQSALSSVEGLGTHARLVTLLSVAGTLPVRLLLLSVLARESHVSVSREFEQVLEYSTTPNFFAHRLGAKIVGRWIAVLLEDEQSCKLSSRSIDERGRTLTDLGGASFCRALGGWSLSAGCHGAICGNEEASCLADCCVPSTTTQLSPKREKLCSSLQPAQCYRPVAGAPSCSNQGAQGTVVLPQSRTRLL